MIVTVSISQALRRRSHGKAGLAIGIISWIDISKIEV